MSTPPRLQPVGEVWTLDPTMSGNPMDTRLYSDPESCEYYDLEHPACERDPDYRFYVDLGRRTQGPILELGCGTGRLLVPILRAGSDIDGLDDSRPMVTALRDRLRGEGLETAVHEQSMDRFRIDRSYSLIFIAVTSFQILDTRESQVACLRRCREHLVPGGRVVLDFAPARDDDAPDPGGTRLFRRFDAGEKHVVVYQTVERRPGSPRETARYRYEVHGPDGGLERTFQRTLPWRRLTADELRTTAQAAGFPQVELFGTYELRPLASDDREVVAFLSRPPDRRLPRSAPS